MLSGGITNGSLPEGAVGALLTVAANVPLAVVVTETSPGGSCAGAVAPVTGTGPMMTVAFVNGVVCAASADA
jgi:hypothetical protein